MKLRVEKEMPFAKVGTILETCVDNYLRYKSVKDHTLIFTNLEVDALIKNGWLSVVEESKTLSEKLRTNEEGCSIEYWDGKAEIAREHFVEVAEKALDKWIKLREPSETSDEAIINAIKSDGDK